MTTVDCGTRGLTGPRTDLPDDTIDRVFAAAAARHGQAIALLTARGTTTYDQLSRDASNWSAYLRALPIRADEPIAVCLARGSSVVAPILGILQAGGAYVPLDPTWPSARLEWLLDDCGARVIFTDGFAAVSSRPGRILLDARIGMSEVPPTQLPVFSPASAAYVMYTSGSTGTPKGAIGHHCGTLNRLRWMWSMFPFFPDDVLVQKAPLAFGDSIWELFGGLLHGVPTLYVSDEELADLPTFVSLLDHYCVTRLVVVPALLQALLAEDPPGFNRVLQRLRLVVSSGEALGPDVSEAFLARSPAKLLNLYGSIETAADATWHEVSRASAKVAAPIGVPIANAETRILDASLQPAPPEEPGELYISGALIARGYIGRPRETALRFLPCPGAEAGARMFRTGDLVRWEPTTGLQFLGRVDHQVKIRGMRVELGEVEAALHKFPSVGRAAVVCAFAGAGNARLVAFIENSGPSAPAPAELSRDLAARLPKFMLPSRFIFQPLPRTATGKIDRVALKALAEEPTVSESAEPRGEIEGAISAVMTEVLGLAYVGRDDDFFELGGDSLSALRVASRLNRALGQKIRARDILTRKTVAALALNLQAPSITAVAPTIGAACSAELEAILDEIEEGRYADNRSRQPHGLKCHAEESRQLP